MEGKPRRPIPREDPDSDPPDYEDRPHARPAFVTRKEMERYVNQMFAPVMAGINELRAEAAAARHERNLRAQWDREQREKEQLDAMRERTRSESDLAQALQRPQTPLVFPVQVPKAPESEPGHVKQKYNRTQVIVAVVGAIALVLATAITAIYSQHASPHGGTDPVPIQQHH